MTVEIDARGLKCPWPAIRLAKAMRDGSSGGGAALVWVIEADDPAAAAEIERVAIAAGAKFERVAQTRYRIRR